MCYDCSLSFWKQPQYESASLQPHVSERSASHLEELERKIAVAENKELQLSEFLKQISNKSMEEKKKMEEKVSVFHVQDFLLKFQISCLLKQHILYLLGGTFVWGLQSCFQNEDELYLW